ncbi:MAG: penicillin-binding protein activator [Nocardiopsaceae bacterium]|nr:penicillin-binding protein activator [Nocardiopsaceae bacterium]
MTNRPRAIVAGLAVATGLALAACSGPAGSGASGPHSPVKVGYLLPLTGVFTSNGTSEEDGFKLGLKNFGSSVDGHPIDPTYLNTQGEPSDALTAATQLVTRDHVQLVEGPLLSSEISVVAPFVLGRGTVEDDLYLASPEQESDYGKYHLGFTSDWNGYQPTSEGAAWAYNTMHWRHVTVVGLNISYGWQGVGGFEAEFKKLGGTIDKSIWVPSDAVEMSSYVSSIPNNTQAVFVVLSGSQAANFVNTYAQFGLKGKVPLMGITTLTDQAALPAEHSSAATGVYTDAQYCDDLPSAVNQKFANDYHAAYGEYPSYYSEAGYTKAEILVKALRSLHGDVTSEAALAKAMEQVHISAPRGPVSLSPATWSPVENEYICKVENVHGTLRNVPIVTDKNVQPWGTLPKSVYESAFAKQSSGPPSP